MKKTLKRFLLSIASVGLLSIYGCGGGDGGNTDSKSTNTLAGKVIAKLTGGTIGQITAEVKSMTADLSTIDGTLELDGSKIPFSAPVKISDGSFTSAFADTYPNSQDMHAGGTVSGNVVVASDNSLNINNGKLSGMYGPAPDAASRAMVPFSGGIEGGTSGSATVSGGASTSARDPSTISDIQTSSGLKKITTTLTVTERNQIGNVCGVTLLFGGISSLDTRILNCGGTGLDKYGYNTPPHDRAEFQWGFAVSGTGQLDVRSFKEWGFYTDDKAALIYYRFTSGDDQGSTYSAFIGVAGGKVLLGPKAYQSN